MQSTTMFPTQAPRCHAYRDRGLPIPEPTPATCQECRELLALPPVDDPAACTTRDEVVLQHLLSHLLPLVPDLPPSTSG
ncbi:hypothetical protein [Streptomyces sp. 8K308]|uniref:hypothetical protein n=1 Tax=Streptomyces sp. 8K308 TaxID=2530388 RepID=UPI00104EF03F|nr:hypothetical protein [Streptomyces sp. 8K308]